MFYDVISVLPKWLLKHKMLINYTKIIVMKVNLSSQIQFYYDDLVMS